MAIYRRVFPFVAGKQTFTMPYGYESKITYHCWGGGGAAGGDSNDIQAGNGAAGTYTTGQFLANPGDQITIVTGQGGTEGIRLESNRRVFDCAISGSGSSGVGPTASYGWVNDPTAAVYPEYNSPLGTRTFGSWTTFMNAWAVSNLANNQPGTEEVDNDIYFPESGNYDIQIAGDNLINVWFRDVQIATNISNFKTDPYSRNISVPSPGVYRLRYVLTNNTGSSGNPAGAAILITRNPTSAMGGGAVQTYPGNVSTKNVIWSTRYGRGVDVTNRVPVCYAPVVNFYQPQSGYDWGGIPDRGMAFVSATHTWTSSELAKLNLDPSRIVPISYPVKITGVGNIDQVVASGYYTFARGQTWNLARYNWLGNPGNNTNLYGRGSGTPSNWTEKQWYNDNRSGRSSNVTFASWELSVPADDKIYIVGYADGVIYNAPSQRGSDNVRWSATSTFGQQYAGGNGGASVKNLGTARLNYYGGWGGQIGSGKTSGGGGGGGGASLILWKQPAGTNASIVTVAGGGGGGGGAGFAQYGSNANGNFEPGSSYPNTFAAGNYGTSGSDSGGGGGGGGGGTQGGRGGAAANQGDAPGRGGEGAWAGNSTASLVILDFPPASLVMIGRGGDGGGGGGGGGAGELVVSNNLKLRRSQFIQVGGNGDQRLEGDPSAIWWSETEYIVAGPGGRGGSPGAAYGKNGNGQPGGCINGDTATSRYGGSGGGGGTTPNKSSASGGSSKNSSFTTGFGSITSYTNSGGGTAGGPSYSSGGGGGSGGGGSGGQGSGQAGNGGLPKTIALGSTGISYTLGGGGGGSCGAGAQSPVNVGLGGGAGAGDGASGVGNELEFTKGDTTTTFYVPRNVTTMYIQGVGAGGGGGNATRGGGGGGAGGYLPRTPYAVAFGQKITVRPGAGVSGDGQSTIITLNAIGNIPTTVITLEGGRQGQGGSVTIPQGGAGGAPNGASGNRGGNPNNDGKNWFSGSGAGSPYGEGGSDQSSADSGSRPGNGGYGAGGGGGVNRAGGLGGSGFVRFDWQGAGSQQAQPNTGSGGGGGYDGGGGSGGSGFVAIAYAGDPIFKFSGTGTIIQQNGYTIHEMYSSGYLTFGEDIPAGSIYTSDGVHPSGTGVTGYIPGSGSGGFGQEEPSAFPIYPNSQYPAFLNQFGVWNSDPASTTYNRTYTLAIPQTTTYLMKCAANSGATVKINDKVFFDMNPPTRDNGQYWWRNVQETRRTIEAGVYTLTINATTTGNSGAFALTIAFDNNQNEYVFDSRRPPVTGGSAAGGNGLVILEFNGNESTAKLKADNAWKKLLTTNVKVSGTWRPVPEAWVKVDGNWLPLYGGGGPITPTVDTTDYGQGTKP